MTFVRNMVRKAFRMLPRSVKYHLKGRWQTPRQYEFLSGRVLVKTVAQLRAGRQSPVICFLPTHTWYSTGFQRPQQMAMALAEIGCHVLYPEPWEHPDFWMAPDAKEARKFTGLKQIKPNLRLLRVPENWWGEIIKSFRPDALVMLWPEQAKHIPDGYEGAVIYEQIDDHELFPDATEDWRKMHEHWLGHADIMVVTADDLYEQIKGSRPDALLLPNGVRLGDWLEADTGYSPLEMHGIRKAPVVVGYYGAIAPWLDFQMLEQAAEMRKEWAFVFLGYIDERCREEWARVARRGNIHYLGKKNYQDLKAYVAMWDVATIPFVLNKITHACSPVKLFEYMAAGKPIVATRMREILKYRSVLFADDAAGFVRQVETAIQCGAEAQYKKQLREEAEANTWTSRARLLRQAIEEAGKRKGASTKST